MQPLTNITRPTQYPEEYHREFRIQTKNCFKVCTVFAGELTRVWLLRGCSRGNLFDVFQRVINSSL